MTEQEKVYKVLNAPEKIYIQVGDFCGDDIDYKEVDEEQCTFSTGTVFDSDLEYVSISEQDKFAIGFAVWILKSGFEPSGEQWFNMDGDGKFYSTSYLFDLYKQSLTN